jgi:CHAD domain-containing protein
LAEVAGSSPGELGTAAELLTRALDAAVTRLTRNESGIRLDDPDPECVHQARVGTRRLRTILKEFQPLFVTEWSRSLRAEVKSFAVALGAVRDVDVMIARLQIHVDALVVGERGEALAVMNRLHKDREAELGRLSAALRAPSYTQLLEHVIAAGNQPQLARDALQPAEGLVAYVARAFATLKNAVNQLDKDPQSSDLHRVRILTKRVRYCAETLVPVGGKSAARFADLASDLQDVLGDLQDATVANGWLRDFAHSSPQAAFVAGKLAGMETMAEQAARRQWRGEWSSLDTRKLTNWMAR